MASSERLTLCSAAATCIPTLDEPTLASCLVADVVPFEIGTIGDVGDTQGHGVTDLIYAEDVGLWDCASIADDQRPVVDSVLQRAPEAVHARIRFDPEQSSRTGNDTVGKVEWLVEWKADHTYLTMRTRPLRSSSCAPGRCRRTLVTMDSSSMSAPARSSSSTKKGRLILPVWTVVAGEARKGPVFGLCSCLI